MSSIRILTALVKRCKRLIRVVLAYPRKKFYNTVNNTFVRTMPSKKEFSKKIKDLTFVDEIEYTEDFFKEVFHQPLDTDTAIAQIKKQARGNVEEQQRIAPEMTGEDIDEAWLDQTESYDGQLAVDVFQTEDQIIVTSTVAGVRVEDLDIAMNGDMLTIKGLRRQKFNDVQEDDYFIRECYWGGFSRSIILPVDIQHDKIKATLEHGILTIILPKSQHSRNGKIAVVDLTS